MRFDFTAFYLGSYFTGVVVLYLFGIKKYALIWPFYFVKILKERMGEYKRRSEKLR